MRKVSTQCLDKFYIQLWHQVCIKIDNESVNYIWEQSSIFSIVWDQVQMPIKDQLTELN
jgi:hypothetical protein